MKKHIFPLISLVIMCLIVLQACHLPTSPQLSSSPTNEVQGVTPSAKPLPSQTFAIQPSLSQVPTVAPLSEEGQIVFRYQGNLWRYLFLSGKILKLTTDGKPFIDENTYSKAQFSPDGQYLAINRGEKFLLLDLTTSTISDMSSYGSFIKWSGKDLNFYTSVGNFTCPSFENLEDEELINFDIRQYDLQNLSDYELIANISGGLKYVQALSNDGQWASIVNCLCYSECVSETIWNLADPSEINASLDLPIGNVSFSPNNQQVIFSRRQIFGFEESALYVSPVDLSAPVSIFSIPGTAPIDEAWSPDGKWIAFTSISPDSGGLPQTNGKLILIRPDGSGQKIIEADNAQFLAWSPQGTALLYSKVDGGSKQLYIYDLLNGTKTLLPFSIDDYSQDVINWGKIYK